MSLWLDVSYFKQILYRLDSWSIKKESPFLANGRCHNCGDSSLSDKKKRGYALTKNDHLLIYCHNCGYSKQFKSFLKDFDPNLYEQYNLDAFKEKMSGNKMYEKETKEPEKIYRKTKQPKSIFDSAENLASLPKDHIAVKYVKERKIPLYITKNMYFTDAFFCWASDHSEDFKKGSSFDHPRLIIPWFDVKGEVFAYQARTFGKETPKYYTVILNPEVEKIYGKERWTPNKKTYVIEGPIDSLFLPNCLAVGDAGLTRVDGDVYIWDNEPRSKNITTYIERALKNGKNVFIPPEGYIWKDLNDAITKGGINPLDIKKMIDNNTFSGINGLLKFNKWCKIK